MQTISNAELTPTERSTVAYFWDGAKARSEHRIGMEVEHLCVRERDHTRIPFFGESASVVSILKSLLRARGGQPVTEAGSLVGMRAAWGKVTLEPGGQIEWSSRPFPRLSELLSAMREWLACFREEIAKQGVTTIDAGFDNSTPTANIPWVPKRRYSIMRRYYRPLSRSTYPVMANTAGVHVSLDYGNAEDWQRKFRAMLLLTPVVTAIFANSPMRYRRASFEAVRPLQWLALDPARCQPPSRAFEPGFSLAEWARWTLTVPRMLSIEHGKLVPGPETPFGHAGMTPDDHPRQWKLHLSSIFTPVRTKQFLELRTIDMQPDNRLAAIPAFWHGLLYSQRSLTNALDVLAGIRDEASWYRLLTAACRDGLDGDPWLRPAAEEVMRMAMEGICDSPHDESVGLEALAELAAARGLDECRLATAPVPSCC